MKKPTWTPPAQNILRGPVKKEDSPPEEWMLLECSCYGNVWQPVKIKRLDAPKEKR